MVAEVNRQGWVPQVGLVIETGTEAMTFSTTGSALQLAKVSQAVTVKFAIPDPEGVP